MTIWEDATQCFEDIPIKTPTGVGFVQPSNWLFVSTSAPQPCSRHFGLKILTQEDIWIEINPQLKTIPIPGILPSNKGDEGIHEDLSSGGFYSTKELESWQRHIEIGAVHYIAMKKFTLGVCLHKEECSFDSDHADLPQFDMGRLQNPL